MSVPAQTHFRLHFYGAIAALRQTLPAPQESPELLGFLEGYYQELGESAIARAEGGGWWDALEAWEAGVAERLPIRALREAAGLDRDAMLLLFLVGLPEEDGRFGVLFEALHGVAGQRRPTAGLLASWWPEQAAFKSGLRALRELGLLEVADVTQPRGDWALAVTAPVWDVLAGQRPERPAPWGRYRAPQSLPRLDELVLEPDTRRAVEGLRAVLDGGAALLLLRGPRSTGRRSLAGAAARELGRGLLELDSPERLPAGGGALAALLDAVPFLALEPAPDETLELPPLEGSAGPLAVAVTRHGGVRCPGAQRVLVLELGLPDVEGRVRLWQRALGTDATDARRLAEGFRMTAGSVARTAELAQAEAALAGREQPGRHEVRRALRTLHGEALDTLARRVPVAGSLDDLAVSDETRCELELLEARCRHRERLPRAAAPALARQLTPGVRALFSGPSGTGKTLAARLLAAALEKDLYALDLSRVVNKFLGETEKNLDKVFCRAEELDVVLLLDEGDALLTRRTDVSTANDRYANLETNYLLQRLETYEGILIVTTNAGERIDDAFRRRLDVVVEFRVPDALERWQIWNLHLPPAHQVGSNHLDELAARCALSGGQIRNAVLHASLLALSGGTAVHPEHVEAGVRREYRKAGLVCPLRTPEPIVG